MRLTVPTLATLAVPALLSAQAPSLAPHQQLARDIYKELIEINTRDSVGNTTTAANAMAKRFRDAGIPGGGHLRRADRAPDKGNVVAIRYRGTGARKPLLLLAHLDVVAGAQERLVARSRSVRVHRARRLLLRARHERRQGDGGDLRRQPAPLQARRLRARSRHHPRAHGGRRGRRLERRPLASRRITRARSTRRSRSTKAAAARCATASRCSTPCRRAEKVYGELRAVARRIAAGTRRCRATTTRSTSSPQALAKIGAVTISRSISTRSRKAFFEQHGGTSRTPEMGRRDAARSSRIRTMPQASRRSRATPATARCCARRASRRCCRAGMRETRCRRRRRRTSTAAWLRDTTRPTCAPG